MRLTTVEIFFYAMAAAFVVAKMIMPNWVVKYYMWRHGKWNRGDRLKPLDCGKCLTGWLALLLALSAGHGWQSILFLFGGVFLGAIMEVIIMRYL